MVNQPNAQIKLTEIWKAVNVQGYPPKVNLRVPTNSDRTTRSVTNGAIKEFGTTECPKNSFLCDGIRIWNKPLDVIKACKNIHVLKREMETFVKMLPL